VYRAAGAAVDPYPFQFFEERFYRLSRPSASGLDPEAVHVIE
jgi:hypothetical protein